MNRPNKKDYTFSQCYQVYTNISGYYIRDLEEYCDELEKAFDKALHFLSDAMYNIDDDISNDWTQEQWKEWAMQEDDVELYMQTYLRTIEDLKYVCGELQDDNEMLKKALNKACEHLVSNNICCLDICPFKEKENCVDLCTNKEKWKEWFLKSEKN